MDILSIIEANKIRSAMGMPLLPVPSSTNPPPPPSSSSTLSFQTSTPVVVDTISTLDARQAAASSNWSTLETQRLAALDRTQRKEKLKKERDASARFSHLSGRGLGDLDPEEEEQDTRSWILGSKKRQKKIVRERELENDKERKLKADELRKSYTAKDLGGVKVGHEMEKFDGQGEVVLTLKDRGIGNGEEEDDSEAEDELENADLLEKEKTEENVKKKGKIKAGNTGVYDPNANDEAGQGGVLSKYDEEIDGKKRKRFVLDDMGGSMKKQKQEEVNDGSGSGNHGGRGIKVSLDSLLDTTPVSDYAEASAVKIKKPKKTKKSRSTKRRDVEEDGLENSNAEMGIDKDFEPRPKTTIDNFDDEEDMQTQLAKQRREILKKQSKMDPAELARQIREENNNDDDDDDDDDEDAGMIIDETREFVSHLRKAESEDEDDIERKNHKSSGVEESTINDNHNHDDEDEDQDQTMQESTPLPNDNTSKTKTSTGLDEETTTSSIGDVVSMLRSRGHISSTTSSESSATATRDRAHASFLAANRALIDEYEIKARQAREADRASGKLAGLSEVAKQEYARKENERREAYLAQLLQRHFEKEYRPDITLKYSDEDGRAMNQKEAFKHLSHMFHGKGSGKGKLEKRLKKIEDEKRREGKGILDGGGEGMGGRLQDQSRKRGQAGVRLQ